MESGAPVVILVAALFLTASAPAIPGGGGGDPACGALGPGTCMVRATKCALVTKLAQGKNGPVKDVFDCAAAQGIPKTQVVSVIGVAFQSGQPETIVDRVITNDTAAALQLRRCVLTAGGLVRMNGTVDRAAMVGRIAASTSTHPAVVDTIAAAVTACPEPPLMQMKTFLTCVRAACIQMMPPNTDSLPAYSSDDNDDHKKCKKGKKGKKCKKQ
ncbi:uncharacterized protein [Procambarus clarkii]|uniref:uncharacterized protein n=1 Tax=Procambarus clarkii TaxID=6728 RepID=UPI003742C1F1